MRSLRLALRRDVREHRSSAEGRIWFNLLKSLYLVEWRWAWQWAKGSVFGQAKETRWKICQWMKRLFKGSNIPTWGRSTGSLVLVYVSDLPGKKSDSKTTRLEAQENSPEATREVSRPKGSDQSMSRPLSHSDHPNWDCPNHHRGRL